MMFNYTCRRRSMLALGASLALLGAVAGISAASRGSAARGLRVLAESPVPGLECEIAGVYPHPANDALYFAAANEKPDYQPGQHPLLPAQYRGKLLLVNRHTGKVVNAFPLTGGQYGGIGYGEGHLFVSHLEPPEILKVDLNSGAVVDRIPISGPAGGLKYDGDRSVLVAQLYVSYPHLAVVDPKTKATLETLWSDESAMDLAAVKGDWLCTWVSGFDKTAFSELRLLDRKTGEVKGRAHLDGVYTSMAPLDKKIAGVDGFIAMVKVDPSTGRVVLRRHEYDGRAIRWM